jgi:predicted acyltransferase
MANGAAAKSATTRILSIDALRGFDMFWIMGGEDIAKALAVWTDWPVKDRIVEQLEHVEWEGFRFYDLIFPLFLFLVGVVLPFSLSKLRESGAGLLGIYGRIFRRTALLFALGLLNNNILQFDFHNLRVAGVLQRIAICYGVAALLVLHLGVRARAFVTVAILVGYWALLAYVPAPGSPPADYTKTGNLAAYVDREYLPGKIMKEYYEYGDNEGLLSTIPAVATALLGAFAGEWLRSARLPWRKVLGLMLAGCLCLIAGYVWSFWFPIIKNIWTSSFVLFAGGWSLLLLGLFYGIIDVLHFRRWAFLFVVIGANAITIYVIPHFIDFQKIAHFFFGGVVRHSGSFAAVLEPISWVLVEWLLLFYLWRKGIFLRA